MVHTRLRHPLFRLSSVYAELYAYQGMMRARLDAELQMLDIEIDAVMDLTIWAEAGRAHAAIAARRRTSKDFFTTIYNGSTLRRGASSG